ncbi:hypothetical protein H6P81_012530 [Aristolochia fimbriata]|uniref:Uncharacterized protein n=1 Tax=Aristolochia fimbriata TaxID=158543 RepID=A0AAV7EFC5_ARIFI|nr:hypothetical protein H6P81_012530 [Aristolochia fimbriata]
MVGHVALFPHAKLFDIPAPVLDILCLQFLKMVARVDESGCGFRKTDAMKKQQQKQQHELKGKELMLQCNKGKTSKFKRSSFGGEEDATSSAILLLACLVCSPSST